MKEPCSVSATKCALSARSEWGSAPLGELGRYIDQNNYPPRIRSTLRDAVIAATVELLDFDPDAEVTELPCELLVALAEEGWVLSWDQKI